MIGPFYGQVLPMHRCIHSGAIEAPGVIEALRG